TLNFQRKDAKIQRLAKIAWSYTSTSAYSETHLSFLAGRTDGQPLLVLSRKDEQGFRNLLTAGCCSMNSAALRVSFCRFTSMVIHMGVVSLCCTGVMCCFFLVFRCIMLGSLSVMMGRFVCMLCSFFMVIACFF